MNFLRKGLTLALAGLELDIQTRLDLNSEICQSLLPKYWGKRCVPPRPALRKDFKDLQRPFFLVICLRFGHVQLTPHFCSQLSVEWEASGLATEGPSGQSDGCDLQGGDESLFSPRIHGSFVRLQQEACA